MLEVQKEAENEIRNVKRNYRRRSLEFFLHKSQNVINVFKEFQMHIADAYYKMRKEDTR